MLECRPVRNENACLHAGPRSNAEMTRFAWTRMEGELLDMLVPDPKQPRVGQVIPVIYIRHKTD